MNIMGMIAPSLLASFAILLTWLFWIAVFCGIGMLFMRRYPVDWMAFWVGWGLSIGFLQIWSFAFPVNDAARVVVIGMGVVGLWLNRRAWWWPPPRWLLLVVVIFALWVANRSTLAPVTFDTGLYHLNAVRWAAEYPVVPGLGLLHTRLAFSNAFFLYPALLNTAPWVDKTYHIANGLLFVVLFAHCAAFYNKRDAAARFHLLFIPIILFLLLTGRTVPGVSNDPAIFALGVVVGGVALRYLTEDIPPYGWWLVMLLASIGIAIKYSFGMLGVGFVLLAGWRSFRHGLTWKPVLLGVVIAVLIGLPMLGRSVLMTGYPLYPNTLFPVSVEWRIPVEAARTDNATIRAFSLDANRPPDEVLADSAWFGVWLRGVLHEYYHVLIPFGLMCLNASYVIVKRRERGAFSQDRWWLAIPLISLVFWFFTVPNIRFAIVNFWLLALGWSAITLDTLPEKRRKQIIIGLMCLLLLPSARLLLRDPWLTSGLQPIMPPALERFTTVSGLELWIPAEDSQQCWDSPLPCMAFPSSGLHLRVEGELRHGFTSNNPAQQQPRQPADDDQ